MQPKTDLASDNKRVKTVVDELNLEIIESFSRYNVAHEMVRHFVAKVLYQGQPAFIKIPLADNLLPKIQIEAAWSEFINSQPLSQQRNIRYPAVIALGEQYLLSDWIDAPLLDDEASPRVEPKHIDGVTNVLTFLLDLPKNEFQLIQKQSWSPRKIVSSVREHADRVSNLCSASEFEQAIAVIEKNKDQAVLGVSHGDIGPWQIFDNDPELILFDAEHASAQLPRLKDTANAFMRMYTKRSNTAGLGRILQTVQQHLQLDNQQFSAELFPVLTKWALIGLVDARKDKQHEQVVTHGDKARQLFEYCLEQHLDSLKSM